MVYTDHPRFRLVNPISLGSCGARKARMQGIDIENSSKALEHQEEGGRMKVVQKFINVCRYLELKYLLYATRQYKIIITYT